jgi:hypothetical protein
MGDRRWRGRYRAPPVRLRHRAVRRRFLTGGDALHAHVCRRRKKVGGGSGDYFRFVNEKVDFPERPVTCILFAPSKSGTTASFSAMVTNKIREL